MVTRNPIDKILTIHIPGVDPTLVPAQGKPEDDDYVEEYYVDVPTDKNTIFKCDFNFKKEK